MGGMLRWQSCSTSDFPLKRSKVAAACQPCRTKKMRCDGRQPCSRCMKDAKLCEYRPSTAVSHSNKRRSSNNDGTNTSTSPSKSSHTHSRSSSTPSTPSTPAPAPAPLPPPPPLPKFQWSRFKKLSFHQDLYAALNLSAAPLSSKSGKIPPLLLEFYHLTAQPITIWTRMHLLFLKWYRLQKSPSLYSIRIPADVAKEAVHVFFKYNSLYTLFIDPADITPVLDQDPFFPASTITTSTTNSNNNSNNSNNNNKTVHPTSSLLVDTILALTFLAAGQTLGSDILLDVARFFYDTVHQRWIAMTFPSVDMNNPSSSSMTLSLKSSSQKSDTNSSSSNSSASLKLLTQTAILLIHFQCTAICEEQAYMTSRIAQGCLERLLSADPIDKSDAQQYDYTTLQYTLYAWQIWFALYLYDGQSLISPITKHVSSVDPPAPPTLPLSQLPLSQQQQKDQQLWTWRVLTRYAMFMESLLKANQNPGMTIQDMVDKSQELGSLSTMDKQPTAITSPPASVTCPEQLVGLYHTMLTIQLFSTQWLPHLDFFTQDNKSGAKQQQLDRHSNDGNAGECRKGDNDSSANDNDTECADHDMDPSKKMCIESSQRIIQMVSAMIMTGQYITAHRSSSPLLLFIRYRALCFASVILVPIGQQQWNATGSVSTYLDDALHQLNEIIEKDIQIWPMARQCLYYLQQRLPSHFNLQDAAAAPDDGFFSQFDGMDGGGNNLILDDLQGRPLQTATTTTTTTAAVAAASMMMTSYSPTIRTQRHWQGMKKRDHIDQEQLNKLSLQHDQLSKYATMKKRNVDQRNDAFLYGHQQQPLPGDAIYSRKRHQTYPASTTNYWLPSYSLGGNSVGGPGSFLVLGTEDHSSMLLSASSSTGSSASTSTALSVPSAAAAAATVAVTTAMPTTLKASPPSMSSVSSAFAISVPATMVPMLPTTYPPSLQQQAMCVSQTVMTSMPTTFIPPVINEANNNSNSNNAPFDLVQQASTSSTYHQHHAMAQQQQQQQQAMTAMGMPPTVSSSMPDTSHLLPSYHQSSFNKRPLTTTTTTTTWQYHSSSSSSPARQLLHDTFTASIMETLHATHDPSILHGTGETHPLPPAPTSSPIDTPTPSYLDDVHLQAVSRGLAHHASSMSLTRTTSVDSTATHHNSNDLISNDRHTQEWLYFLYQQQQQQRQHQNYQQHPLPPPPSESSTSTDDPFMLFSSSLPSIPRK